ncbi:alpha/beta hydrolase family protein [Stackebrandtia albiflava]|uniref:Alpha/beta hydrolase family protein n=1 Tax=Stackebrandtia albiflava TaxID=406432 RepID=A0A562VBY0_9ACTN|nr:alpha/beta hydrolase [Stackebrandtia albiflava]TWJ15393.1 alpha/beta hydrolase family protein [Stackebrandtia albiflava]
MNYAELLHLDTGNLSRTAEAVGLVGGRLGDQASELWGTANIPTTSWDGDDAEAATGRIRDRVPPLEDTSQAMLYAQVALLDLVEKLIAAKAHLERARSAIAGTPLTITPEGVVQVPPGLSQADDERYRRLADDVATMIREALTAANTADAEAIAALQGVGAPGAAPPMSAPATMPGEGWSPQQFKDWWDGLSEPERQYMLENHPDVIGNADGIPSMYRDLANRELLGDAIDRTRSEIDALKDERADLPGGPGSEGDRRRLDGEIAALEGRLGGLETIQDRLNAPGTAEYDDRAYLLQIDPSGDGKAVVAVGNPDTADNVFTSVPGTGASVPTIGGDLGRVDRMVFDANQRDPEASTAGILWLGYDAPDAINNAASTSYADGAAPALREFQQGLEVVQGGPDAANNTLFGHSYGTTVIGHTATSGGVAADQMIFVGSPGVGADHASDMGIGAENVYATTAPNDIIHVVPDASWAHNTAPVKEEFGAQVFDTPRYDGSRIAAHSGYWDDGNPARTHFASIITGNGTEVPRGEYHERWYEWRPWN